MARLIVFFVCLLAVWLIWRAVRGMIQQNARQHEKPRTAPPPRLEHDRDRASGVWVAGAAGAGVESSKSPAEAQDARREAGDRVDTPDGTRDGDVGGVGDGGGGDGGGDGGGGGGD